MAGKLVHNLGPKAQGNARRTPKIGENEFQRLQREGWNPEFLAYDNDARIDQIRRLGSQKILLGKAFDPKTGARLDSKKVLVWTKGAKLDSNAPISTKGETNYQRLIKNGWKPRFLADPTDPWIKQERRLGLQQIHLSDPFNPVNDNRVLVWTK